MRIKQVIGLVILFIGPFSIPSSDQVAATWTDSSGTWNNSANWSILTVPNNGGGKTYDVVINGTGADTVTFDAAGTTINSFMKRLSNDSRLWLARLLPPGVAVH
jgi:hypothetical protein